MCVLGLYALLVLNVIKIVFGLEISALFKLSNIYFMKMLYITLIASVSDDVASVFC